ncbi:MAG: hypothetical protein U9Q70_07510 [Chloroflexota bacterium]|nr:hypothetical protein [Chloroflexota bacterium]
MASSEQLEIIRPDRQVLFAVLDPQRGITNIGQDLENDVVLTGDGVAPFHAIVDHRQKPYQLLSLGQGEMHLDGQVVLPNQPTALQPWSTWEIGEYTLMLVEGDTVGAAPPAPATVASPAMVPARVQPTESAPSQYSMVVPPVVAPARVEVAASPPAVRAPLPPRTAVPLVRITTRPPDQPDSVLLAELSERAWTIAVEEAAAFTVLLTNGGPIVATFNVAVAGVPAEWVEITPRQLNFNEGEHGTVTVTITPPQHFTSSAGAHHLDVIVSSANYPGRASHLGATLTIEPYQQFAVSELDPKRLTVGGKPGATDFQLANQGNDTALFRLEATDPERACAFEFTLPDEEAPRAQQAEFRLPPAETFVLPLHITPLRRPFIALRKHRYSFNVNISSLAEGQIPRTLLGELRVRPVIGPWLLLFMALVLMALIVLFFRPRIYTFAAAPTALEAGNAVLFNYETSRFASRWIETDGGTRITLEAAGGTYSEIPEQDTLYTLKSENLLSQLVPRLFSVTSDPIEVDVVPLEPKIRVFAVDQTSLVAGEATKLHWEVLNADNVILIINGQEQTIAPADYTSEREISPSTNPTHYTLQATNQYGGEPAMASVSIKVSAPTPTPLPNPLIQKFNVAPLEIYTGDSVTITWQAENATGVELLGAQYPPNGNTVQTLDKVGVVEYVLTALYDDGAGEQPPSRRNSAPVRVTVRERPTPTPEPEVPVIDDFRIVPNEVVKGTQLPVQLVWATSGDTTNIEITGPTVGTVGNLSAEGSLPVQAEETTFFILTAYNGEDLKVSETVELTVIEPTPTPPPTPTPLPEPLIQYFEAQAVDDPSDVIEESSEGFTKKYKVAYGAKVKFVWSVLNVPQVTLIAGESSSARPPVGEFATTIWQAQDYQLVAANEGGASKYAFIQIVLQPIEVPPAPQNLNGETGGIGPGQAVTLTWTYDLDYVDDIIGFRVYRANTADGIFNRVADEAQLDNTMNSWPDPHPACGQVYYVSAVYLDVDSVRQETTPTAKRWYSWPCATPTPAP